VQLILAFFFSSRRRHTIFSRDWSSDVCSSDLNKPTPDERRTCAHWLHREIELVTPSVAAVVALGGIAWQATFAALGALGWAVPRSEERRVGKAGMRGGCAGV